VAAPAAKPLHTASLRFWYCHGREAAPILATGTWHIDVANSVVGANEVLIGHLIAFARSTMPKLDSPGCLPRPFSCQVLAAAPHLQADDMQGQVWGDNAVHVTTLHPLFAARVEGLDLRQPLTAEQARWVEALMDEYAVLVFPGQNLTDEQQIAFGENFGPLEGETATVDVHRRRLAHARMNDISNLDENGALLAADDRRRFFALGNRLWHSDSSFKRVPAKYSALHGRVVPAQGADTEFADMRAAWDALPPEMQAMTRDLICDHSLIYSRALLGFEDYTAEERVKFAPVPQRLVRRHPGSGRQMIYLSAHIGQIQGWPRPEAMMLIRDLMEHATQRQFVYRHKWAQHDLVLWDNRCTMHRGTRFDDKAEVRDMRRVTLSDRASSLEQAV